MTGRSPTTCPSSFGQQHSQLAGNQKMGNADNADNFKTDYGETCLKGDMVIDESDPNRILIFNWRVAHNPNNQATQAHICNMRLQIDRDVAEVTDDYGYLVKEATTGNYSSKHPLSCIHL